MSIKLEKVPPHRLSELCDPTSLKLKKLLNRNHNEHAILRDPRLILHNHMPHALGSSYLLGATDSQLQHIFDVESPHLVESDDKRITHEEVTTFNWRKFLGQKPYTAAYAIFFDGEVAKYGGDWKKVVEDYVWAGPEPIINGFSGGLGHPFIHLAYAYEFDDEKVATEALSMGCTEYDPTHEILDNPPPDTSTYKTKSIKEVLGRIRADKRFDGYVDSPGFVNLFTLLGRFRSEVFEHWHAWVVEDPDSQLGDCAKMAAGLFMETRNNEEGMFDFFVAHILTFAHALRILLPLWSHEQKVSVMRQYGLYTMMVYIAQLRPGLDWDEEGLSKGGETPAWDTIFKNSLNSKWMTDVHFPKVVRGMKVVEETWGASGGLYQRAADVFVNEFNGWGGYGVGVEAAFGLTGVA
ncbi:MGS207 protein [Colletotrichum tamarilloi]|uniref:MGS207 protein n=1 Tax=Colletotrichum tamarilloi TaxID=1209934 RepID=A0ABQ9R1I1_9PEZI|nr:MGS207 protein [Colletotrichum tamarilloi]KAK1492039.1 MGS207 protein [Colletotrichum tamarilloi]